MTTVRKCWLQSKARVAIADLDCARMGLEGLSEELTDECALEHNLSIECERVARVVSRLGKIVDGFLERISDL